jgi:hypothetical protein
MSLSVSSAGSHACSRPSQLLLRGLERVGAVTPSGRSSRSTRSRSSSAASRTTMVVLEAYPCVPGSKPRQHCCSSGVTECEVSGGSGGLKNIKEHKEHVEDTNVYPGAGYRSPSSSSLMILVFKNIQTEGLQQSAREIWQGIALC